MAIYVGGAGAVIIGGLYWKKGTTEGAWSALITGSGLAVGGILARLIWPEFPLNGMQVSFTACLSAVVVYVVVSLLTCKEDFNMDRLLHRGQYAKITTEVGERPWPISPSKKRESSPASLISTSTLRRATNGSPAGSLAGACCGFPPSV